MDRIPAEPLPVLVNNVFTICDAFKMPSNNVFIHLFFCIKVCLLSSKTGESMHVTGKEPFITSCGTF